MLNRGDHIGKFDCICLSIVWITHPLSKNKKYSFTRNYPLWSVNKETTSRFSKEQTSLDHSNLVLKIWKKIWSDWFFPCDYALLGEIGDINIALKRKQRRQFLSMNGDKMTSKIHLYITYLIIASDMKQFYMIFTIYLEICA